MEAKYRIVTDADRFRAQQRFADGTWSDGIICETMDRAEIYINKWIFQDSQVPVVVKEYF